jgi:hypothetical protein
MQARPSVDHYMELGSMMPKSKDSNPFQWMKPSLPIEEAKNFMIQKRFTLAPNLESSSIASPSSRMVALKNAGSSIIVAH